VVLFPTKNSIALHQLRTNVCEFRALTTSQCYVRRERLVF
jgi:hypothetical protein